MRILALSTLMVLSSFFASAQGLGANQAQNTVNVTITNSITLAVKSNSTQAIAISGADDYTNGVESPVATLSTFSVASNRGYNITVQPTTQYFSVPTGTSSTALPASKLSVKEASAANYDALVYGSPLPVYSSDTRGKSEFSVRYKATPSIDEDYKDGVYSITLTYTATQK